MEDVYHIPPWRETLRSSRIGAEIGRERGIFQCRAWVWQSHVEYGDHDPVRSRAEAAQLSVHLMPRAERTDFELTEAARISLKKLKVGSDGFSLGGLGQEVIEITLSRHVRGFLLKKGRHGLVDISDIAGAVGYDHWGAC
jgi:hypothetical protein